MPSKIKLSFSNLMQAGSEFSSVGSGVHKIKMWNTNLCVM